MLCCAAAGPQLPGQGAWGCSGSGGTRSSDERHERAVSSVTVPAALVPPSLAEVQLLGALVEGWDEDRVRAGAVLTHPFAAALRLAGRLGLPSIEALVQHAARRGWYVPPALWH